MHDGSPRVDEMIAMPFAYPNLYVDVACNDFAFLRAQLHAEPRRLVEAGFAGRTMYGSNQMYWPEAIGQGIGAIEDAPFQTAGQKRDILYGNAARFMRLMPAQVAAGHAPSAG